VREFHSIRNKFRIKYKQISKLQIKQRISANWLEAKIKENSKYDYTLLYVTKIKAWEKNIDA